MKFKHRESENGTVKFVFRTTKIICCDGWKLDTKRYLGKIQDKKIKTPKSSQSNAVQNAEESQFCYAVLCKAEMIAS